MGIVDLKEIYLRALSGDIGALGELYEHCDGDLDALHRDLNLIREHLGDI